MAITFNTTHMLFPTPVVEFLVEDPERLNALLREEIALRVKSEAGEKRSNIDGWHSASDLFAREEPGHQEIAGAIKLAVRDATRQIGGGTKDGGVRFQLAGWINVNPPGGFNMPHDHPGAFWSGVYYVSVPEPPANNPERGAISFIDHRPAPAGQPLVQAPMFQGNATFRPREGAILLFPGTARHWVLPQSDAAADRISIAFNAIAAETVQAG